MGQDSVEKELDWNHWNISKVFEQRITLFLEVI
jgi:hypothetical protein